MRAVDTHAHLDFPQFNGDRSEIIADLESKQIGIINVATSLESNLEVDRLTSNRLIWGTVGLHPTEIKEDTLSKIPQIVSSWEKILASNRKIVAIGEIGLDYFRDSTRETAHRQTSALREFLTFAQEKKLPVIFHCRDAYGDLVTILKDYTGIRGVVHCFSGSQSQADQFLKLGLTISFTANITYSQNEALLEIATSLPEEKLLLETDCPFLAPNSKRGSRNDPTSILELAEVLAVKRGLTKENILNITTANAVKLFGLN